MEVIPREIVHPDRPCFRIQILDNAVIVHNGPLISAAWIPSRDKATVLRALDWLATWPRPSVDSDEDSAITQFQR